MVHVYYDPNTIDWSGYFDTQYGEGYIVGLPYQRGYGVGNLLRGLFRFLTPIGKEVGREGLRVGANVLSNIVSGAEPKEAIRTESREGLKNLLKKASTSMTGGGRKRRVSVKSKRGRKRSALNLSPYNRKFDSLGYY